MKLRPIALGYANRRAMKRCVRFAVVDVIHAVKAAVSNGHDVRGLQHRERLLT